MARIALLLLVLAALSAPFAAGKTQGAGDDRALPRVGKTTPAIEMSAADSVRSGDRQRLLDRLTFVQAEKARKEEELVALRNAQRVPLGSLPVVQALGKSAPFSALAVDALRDELFGLEERFQAANSGVSVREAEMHTLLEQYRRAEEDFRLANDRLAQPGDAIDKNRLRGDKDLADLRRRIAEAEVGTLSADIEKMKYQRGELEILIDEIKGLLAKVIDRQKLDEQDLDVLRARAAAVLEGLSAEIKRTRKRQQRYEAERDRLLAQSGTPSDLVRQRLDFLNQAIQSDSIVIDRLNGLDMLAQLSVDVWEKRLAAFAADDAEVRRQVYESLQKVQKGLLGRQRLSKEQHASALTAVRDQEARVANSPPDTPEQKREQELLNLLLERVSVHDRAELAASRLERQLARWMADAQSDAQRTVRGRIDYVGGELAKLLRAFWNYELFAVEDVSDIDGKKVSVSYGVTVGKSVGALFLFVIGYAVFSRLANYLQRLLMRQFGVSTQLASVIRRWLMIMFALGLLLFILNIARIPLTVFAFMGGALAIGIGFGTQTIIKNFISGVIILFERKIRVGDIVDVGGVVGYVTAVDLRATTVKGFDGVEALVPNSNFLENQVVNWTYSNPQMRKELRVGIAYGADAKSAERVLLEVAAAHACVLKDPAPDVFFENFGNSDLQLVLVFWVDLAHSVSARAVESDLRHAIYQEFQQAGLTIPFPQQDVNLAVKAPIPVSIAR